MRREHVVVGGDNGEIGGGAGTQSLLLVSGARGETMREIGTSERATVRPTTPHCLDAPEIFLPRSLAARANAGRDIGDYSLHHLWLLAAAGQRDAACITSIDFFAPAASIALDKSDRGGGAPSAG
jgi:hypothetical protein